ncbi:hypothetical protein [Mesorhizobium sp. M0036]|uniref:hypothetical protein n=1 Tax=Mesorhizobium sp. M0036 TaxID=2956853 RepID=UPI003337B367
MHHGADPDTREDARRPNRERETLVGEQTRLVNRIKAILTRFSNHAFKPTLRKAADKFDSIRTAEGTPLPDNTPAKLYRFLERLCLVREQIRAIERERLRRLAAAPAATSGPHAMVRLLAWIIGMGVQTADMLVNVILTVAAPWRAMPVSRGRRTRADGEDARKACQCGQCAGAPSMIQLAWRFFLFQKASALARWFRARTSDGRKTTRKRMVVALARKLLIALWRPVTAGEVPQGVLLRPA